MGVGSFRSLSSPDSFENDGSLLRMRIGKQPRESTAQA